MKFHRFVSFLSLATILALAPASSRCEDDLPDPSGTESAVGTPPPEDVLPDPSLGDGKDSLPEPGESIKQENTKNQVNVPVEDDEVFLPAPAGQESINYAPVAREQSTRGMQDSEWRLGMENRPIFSLQAGGEVYNYPSEAVKSNRSGPSVGGSIRVIDIAQTVFLHGFTTFSWIDLGGVGPFTEVKDTVIHAGAMIEIGIGRRISLFGSLAKVSHTLKSGPDSSKTFGTVEKFSPDIINEGWKLGLGGQYDFYVVPHGSIGVKAHVEQDMALVALTMALEPKPKKRLSLNFQDAD